nr:hypothetical protein [Tanacetum cinerariifolium]
MVVSFFGPMVKQNVRYEPKANTSTPKKGATNMGNASNNDNTTSSNSFSALNVEGEEEEYVVQNVYDEIANLFPNTNTGGVLPSWLLLMTSSDDVRLESLKDTKVDVVKGKLRKPHKGSNAGVRAESSPSDAKGGKSVVSNLKTDVIKKVLSIVSSGSYNSLKFDMGSYDENVVNCPLKKIVIIMV